MNNYTNKALFLDRDGVVNVEKNYLHKVDDFEFIEGIFELCLHYQKLGYLIFVVTNQSGIARNYYTSEDFDKLSSWMINQFEEKDIKISQVYYCPHHPDITGDCLCRKPNPGMLLEAKEQYNLDMKNSIIVGDKESDIMAGYNAGIKEAYLLDESGVCSDSLATKVINKLDKIWK